jgi:hypothetical protein
MATHRTPKGDFRYWDRGDREWHVQMAETCLQLEADRPATDLRVTIPESERAAGSSTLHVKVAEGYYALPDGRFGHHGGDPLFLLAASSVNYLFLDSSGVLTVNQTGMPGDGGGAPAAAVHTPLAVATTDAATVLGVEDRRIGVRAGGTVAVLSVGGGAFDDAAGVVTVETGTTNGTMFGAGATSKFALRGKAPIALPAGANQAAAGAAPAALVDSTGGTANGTVVAVSGSGADATINDNFADLIAKVNALCTNNAALVALGNAARQMLVDQGLWKGSA